MPQTLQTKAKLLMIRMSALGDILFALESLSSLKEERPDLEVDFLVDQRFASLLQDHPLIHQLLVYPRKQIWRIPAFLWRLRRKRYDLVLDLHGLAKSSLAVFASRAKRKVGYAAPGSREGAAMFYSEKVHLPLPLPHRAERGLLLLRGLGLKGEAKAPVLAQVEITSPDPDHVQAPVQVILHPGTSNFAAFKRWPLARFVALGLRLQKHGLRVGMSYGPGEEAMAQTMQEEMEELVVINGKALGLLGLAETMRQAQVVVAADTGPLHIAAAQGTKVVALFGPKDAGLYGPRGEGHKVLFHAVPCRPCKLRDCPSPQCILGISVDEAESAVLELVGA